jgi:putative tricarboxylic transport membrane protein
MKKTILVLAVLFLSLSVLMANGASEKAGAGDWAKNVELQVPATAGGGTDVMARALATYVSKASGSNITIVNNTDGGGAVAVEKVYNAKSDGSTLLFWHSTMLIKSAMDILRRKVADDYSVIGVSMQISPGGYMLIVPVDSDIKTFDDVINKARANPGKLLVGVETGGTSHIMAGGFAKAAGINLKYVEAGPDTEKLTALVGKSIDLCFVNPNQAKQYVDAGKVKALACVSKSDGLRSDVLPDVPTLKELGVNFAINTPIFVLGPKSMDPALVKTVHDYFAAAAEDESVNKILRPAGMELRFFSMEEGLQLIKNEQTADNAIVEELGLKQK